ncbi:MAG TPA: hypothetical protein VJ851_04625 [Jatrophihabitans sp.]|nr:hypothetical protein [Jatrophihabitans sp.]
MQVLSVFGICIGHLAGRLCARSEPAEEGRELGLSNLVVNQPEALEDGLVQVPPDDARRRGVLAVTPFEQHQRPVDCLFELLALEAGAIKSLVRGRQLASDPFLLDLELIQRHGTGIVSLE